MNQIGTIIRYYREINALSREKLSEGICSPKYLYLIEKGERTPSNAILAKFGERMNTNLFEYYSYLECDDPIIVKKIIEDFSLHRRHLDYDWLALYQDIGESVPDFNKIPWKFEVGFNKALLKLVVEHKSSEAARDILDTISQMPAAYQYSVCHLRQLILLSLCHLEAGKEKAANFTIEQVQSVLANKLDCTEFRQLCFVSAYIFMIIKIKTGNPDIVIEFADKIMQQQNEKNFFDLHHFSLLLKGCALIQLGDNEEARCSINRGLMALLVFDKSRDIDYLNHIGILPIIMQSGIIDENLSQALWRKYQI